MSELRMLAIFGVAWTTGTFLVLCVIAHRLHQMRIDVLNAGIDLHKAMLQLAQYEQQGLMLQMQQLSSVSAPAIQSREESEAWLERLQARRDMATKRDAR